MNSALLLEVADVLDAAHLAFTLVRGNTSAPVLAMDAVDRAATFRALARAFADDQVYADAISASDAPSATGGIPALVSTVAPGSDPSPSAFRIFRADDTSRALPPAEVQVEFWSIGADTITLPRPNALTRVTLPRREAVATTIERFDRRWPTLQGMFCDLATDVSFDIDLVFSWVGNAGPAWENARLRRMAGYHLGEGDGSDARYRQLDELKYALRSVYRYAPWVHRIFIATDCARPDWLADDPRFTLVRSDEFFADPSVLPTHNSHAVESQLHRIPGLAEHFLYSNDDMFFGRRVEPSMFFSPGGVSKFIQSPNRIGLGDVSLSRSGYENAARVNRRLLRQRFGRTIARHLEHAPTPLRKSVLFDLEREFPLDFARTAASAFRSATDISVTNSLYHYFALLTGRAVVQTGARVSYIDTTTALGLADMAELLESRCVDFFCLNDGSSLEVTASARADALTRFLESYFPVPGPWENQVNSLDTQTPVSGLNW
ncbi:MAG: stealth conserved region 3 domain-containing protein [Terrimesophilobacter sp.]